MYFSAVFVLYSIHIAICAGSTLVCTHDNCLRAVIGSAFPTRHGSADCTSYFKATVTPSTITVSHTAATTATVPYTLPTRKKRHVAARQETVIPSSIPTYASACSGSLRYSSACSCVGATHTTTTVMTPTTTTTITSTVTQCASSLPTFILQITDSGVVYQGKSLDGTFGNFDDGDGPIIGFNGDPIKDAVVLSLTHAGNLEIDFLGVVGSTNGKLGRPKLINFEPPPITDAIPVICSISHATLKCTSDGLDPNGNNGLQIGVNILQICPAAAVTNDLWIGDVIGDGCYKATFKVIPVCTPLQSL